LGLKQDLPLNQTLTKVSELTHLQVRLTKLAIMVGDLVFMALAFGVSLLLCAWLITGSVANTSAWLSGQDHERFLAWAATALLGLVLLLMSYQHYSDRKPFWDELGDFIRLTGLLALLDIAIVATAQWNASRLWWMVSWSVVLIALIFGRMLTRAVLRQLGLWERPTIIIGIGSNANDAAQALRSQPEMGLRVHCFVDAGGADNSIDEHTYPRQSLAKMSRIAKQPGVQWVIALEHAQSEQREYWLRQLAQWSVPDISVIPAMRGVPLHGTDMSHFFSHEVALLRMRNNLRRWPARLIKRIFDTTTALLLLILLSPLMLTIAYLIRRDGGPALFAHPRIGKKSRVFRCYKFRTMVVDAEKQLEKLLQQRPELRQQWMAERKLQSDPRVNALGHFLRRTSLDELPQLLNVVRGEMSLVGPRPVVRTELRRFGSDVGYYLLVRPGMTGLWQISGRSDIDYDKRVYLDAWYVKNWSFWYDLIILLKTIKVVVKREGAY
jgi:Undecaprenyl-phosphate galactose phosphotransferase WbaP